MTATDHATLIAFDARIRLLVEMRRVDRKREFILRDLLMPFEVERKNELRALLRIRSEARRVSRKARQSFLQDLGVDSYMEHRDVIENIEGDPAFSGAFTRW